ncbi:hypothetical protein DSM19430T_03840 [Desulfovibrio psychrotolerans]|uniref:Uncharacterized protein n=1 Tax=Desulfovibrio psychrotolerans TaxID=415242 RepID=A0A7J0BPW7_9BACT|nr:hypothetical protein DSM19430T_03840 [Desulfovibrio psychrotolerans]
MAFPSTHAKMFTRWAWACVAQNREDSMNAASMAHSRRDGAATRHCGRDAGAVPDVRVVGDGREMRDMQEMRDIRGLRFVLMWCDNISNRATVQGKGTMVGDYGPYSVAAHGAAMRGA